MSATPGCREEGESAERYLRVHHLQHLPDLEVCIPVGEIDLLTAPLLERALRATRQRRVPRVVVDLSRVEFLSVAGVGVLATAAEQAQATNCRFGLVVCTRPVQRVLDLTGVSQWVACHSCLSEAVGTCTGLAGTGDLAGLGDRAGDLP